MCEDSELKENPEQIESQRVKNISRDLNKWLSRKRWKHDELRDWLKGYKFFTYGDEPFLWLFKCLPRSSKHLPEMARRIAAFLSDQPSYKSSEKTEEDDERFYYNLFNLAAGLGYRKELGTALEKIFGYFSENTDERDEFFAAGSWYNLNNAFREALINNQTGDTLKNVWRGGLKHTQKSFLVGDMYSSFRGLLYMPRADKINEPDVDELGWALRKMADYLKEQKSGHVKFRRLLERLKEVWPDFPDWDEVLIGLAIRNEWPDWAVVRLDKLVLPLNKYTNRQQHYIIWPPYVPFLEAMKVRPVSISKTGVLLETPTSGEVVDFLTKTVPTVERRRLRSPDGHYRSILGVANQGFIELQSSLDSAADRKLARIIEQGRPGLLQKLGLQ